MVKVIKWEILHKWYKYKYTIKDLWIDEGEHIQHFYCKWAWINQNFVAEDIPGLIEELHFFIDVKIEDNKKEIIKLRVSKLEKLKFQEEAEKLNMSLSKYIKTKCILK
jgi:hypothetical protein